MVKRWIKWITLITTSLLLTACTETDAPEIAPGANQQESEEGSETEEMDYTGTDAQMAAINVDLYNSNSEVVGTAIFDEGEEQVTLTLSLENVTSGELSVRIHENGMATPPSFEDAGEELPYVDSLLLEVSESGVVNQSFELSDISLLPDAENSLAMEEGTSIIIHNEAGGEGSESRLIGGVIFPPQ